nr:PEP/pyruvate-binding domain-containing protein [Salinarimonas rosea]
MGSPASRHVVFGTKAQTLDRLAAVATTFKVLPAATISARDWTRNGTARLASIVGDPRFSFPLIVRSSFSGEDSGRASMAGAFCSVLDVSSPAELRDAIVRVFRSYERPVHIPFGQYDRTEEHVLVQPMARDVALSGVLTTVDAKSSAPYIVIDYAPGSDTSRVTSGAAGTRTTIVLKGHGSRLQRELEPLRAVIDELATLFDDAPIDVEFAIDRFGEVTVFQARPLVLGTTRYLAHRASFPALVGQVREAYAAVAQHGRRQGLEDGTLLGVMPDWNPGELIGFKPRPLAYSLYRLLVTDCAWAKGRARLGYHDMHRYSLMSPIGGIPYISVETSFHSLVPASIAPDMRRRIVADACRALRAEPQHHDKIEFRIMPTVFKPDLRKEAWRARFPSLDDAEWTAYLDALLEITNDIVAPQGHYHSAMRDLGAVEALHHEPADIDGGDLIDVRTLLARVRRDAIPLFATAARAAFVATDILKALVGSGTVPVETLDEISRAADSIGARMVDDFRTLDRRTFMGLYGHVRPGTFDIMVPRYDDPSAPYFEASETTPREVEPVVPAQPPGWNPDAARLDAALAAHGYTFGWEDFHGFARHAIHARERVKFLYSAGISDALEIIARVGARFGFDRDTMSFLTVADIDSCLDLGPDLHHRIAEISSANRVAWRRNQPIRLPELLTGLDDVYAFEIRASAPNFITDQAVKAPVASIDERELAGRIVFIESADPGFDWIFTRPIAGFVTKFGGENSHMAIRAREFGLPAVIGAGSSYETWRSSRLLRIDCATRRVEVLL